MDNNKNEMEYRIEAEMLWMSVLLRAFERLKYGTPQTRLLMRSGAEIVACSSV
ncbi:hypothetical protein [Clostridium porci]|uniref:hypothetical protein n=1 Tax=Clostridium porci TaxID=2605778 RepID=UPI0012B43C95|nr:hypothetical protein [Clostridium porci]